MRASKTTPPLYLPIISLAPLRTNPILPPLVLRKYYGKTEFQANIKANIATSIAGHHRKPPPLLLRTLRPLPRCHSERSAAPSSVIPSTARNLNSLHPHHPQTSNPSHHSKSHVPHSAIPNAAPSSLVILNAAQRPLPLVIPSTTPSPPVIPNTVRNLNSLHTHHPQTPASSPHSKRHGPNSAIPNTASLPCHSEQRPFPVIPNSSHSAIPNTASFPCHSERSALSPLSF